jgi:uncharacterized protein DUF3592
MEKSITQKSAGKSGTWGCFAFSLIFFLFGFGFFWLAFGRGFVKLIQARDWTPVPCIIVSSEVKSHGDTYSIEATYSYKINDHLYQGDRYDFVEGSSGGYDSKAAVVARIPPGTNTTCYINPKDANESVLERGFTNEMYFAGLPLLFAFIGLAGMYFAIAGKLGSSGIVPQPKSASQLPVAATKKKGSRWGSLIITVFVAAFWNGIVSVFVWQMVHGWKSGQHPIGLTLFLIPFILVGLFLIGAIFYSFMALLNPVAELVFMPPSVRLGSSTQLSWKIRGRVERIRKLTIRLEACEEATYRRGTSSYTDKEVFYKKELFQTTTAFSMANGSVSISIPRDTMHSLDLSHNKIIWTVYFEGEIKSWPDVSETYELSVVP